LLILSTALTLRRRTCRRWWRLRGRRLCLPRIEYPADGNRHRHRQRAAPAPDGLPREDEHIPASSPKFKRM
jgi:hypothetical protein